MFEYVGSCRIFAGNPTIALGAGMLNLGFLEDTTFNAGVRAAFTSNSNLAGAPNAGGIHYLTPTPAMQVQMKDGQLSNLKRLILNSKLRGVATTSHAITAVNQGAKTFTVATDVSATYTAGKQIAVEDSTGNDGVYTVVSSVYGANTVITVLEEIPSATGDGTLGIATSMALGGGDAFKLVAVADVPTVCLLPDVQAADGASAENAIWLPAAVIDGMDGFTFNRPQQGEIGNPFNTQILGAYRETDQGGASIPVGSRMWFMGPPSALGLTWSLPA